jgi:hypothetical protein
MVTAVPTKQHSHTFQMENIGKGINRGTCKCGEIREYSGYGKEATAKVIQAGDPDYKGEKRKAIIEDRTDEIIAELTGSATKPAEDTLQKPASSQLVRKWIDQNKDAIMADLARLGGKGTGRKWGIKDTAMRNAKIRWGLLTPKTQKPEPAAQKPDAPTSKHESVPEPLGNFADTITASQPVAPPATKDGSDIAISINLGWDFITSLDDEEFDRVWQAVGVVFQMYGRKVLE